MKTSWLVIGGVAAAGLLGAGLWLGHATSASAEVPPAPHEPVAAAPARAHHAAPAPALRAAPPVPGLAADLTDRDPKVRTAALAELVKSGEADTQTLLTASHDPDLNVAVYATTALAKAYAAGNVPVAEMVARATDHQLPERVRVAATNGLGGVATPEAAHVLADQAAHGDVLERRTAVILLQHQDVEIAIPALIDALADSDEYVRQNAVESLRARSRGRDFGTDASQWRSWWQSRPR